MAIPFAHKWLRRLKALKIKLEISGWKTRYLTTSFDPAGKILCTSVLNDHHARVVRITQPQSGNDCMFFDGAASAHAVNYFIKIQCFHDWPAVPIASRPVLDTLQHGHNHINCASYDRATAPRAVVTCG